MNSINNGWVAQNGQKRLIFIVVPEVKTKIREKSKRKKNMRMDKSEEIPLIYIHMYIYTYPRTCKHVFWFLSRVNFAKRIFKFRKINSCAYPTIWDKFKNFIRILRTSVIDKIVDYRIYALINTFTGR